MLIERRTLIIDNLLNSENPPIQYKTHIYLLGQDPSSKKMKALRKEIRESVAAKALLSRYKNRKISGSGNVYDKWQGAHWVLASLADIDYPEGDKSLYPLRDSVLEYWLNENYFKEYETTSKAKVYGKKGVPLIRGRYRRCASQQGNALYSVLKLGLADNKDERISALVERLLYWQWSDGGWNCDRNPSADTSSFMETLIPFRALALYSKMYNDRKVSKAVKKTSEVFLSRRLYKRKSNGQIIHPEFTLLHYPLYWHYDILGGLKAINEAGFIKDKRCKDALDLLESKRLPNGGFPAEKKYYKVSNKIEHGADYLKWGETGKTRMNEWVTVDALTVLKSAGRIKI